MKRNFTESSTRTRGAGCLLVPLFNQKKRNRQPLTSNPLENDPSPNNSAENLDFSTMLADFGWDTAKPEPTRLQTTIRTDKTVPRSLPRYQNTSLQSAVSHAGRNLNNWRLEEKNTSANVWKGDFPAFGSGTENRKILQLEDSADCSVGTGSTQQKLAGHLKASQSSNTGVAEQRNSTTAQWPAVPKAMLRGPQGQSTPYTFKQAPYQQKPKERKADHPQDNKIIQKKGPVHQAKLKENDNSLRIISAVIESMKHWSQHTHKAPLLFEVLGVLDSAVTPGPYGAKTFLLRDGEESVSCLFYEIDRDLPRLIRGHVHRCMGNYNAKQKVFRCVSVRPATVTEQQTFQDFVKTADVEMGSYMKTSNEV